jgi:hypothetical protein
MRVNFVSILTFLRSFFFLPKEALAKPNRLFFLDGFRSLALAIMVLTHGVKTWIQPALETPFSIMLKSYITRLPGPTFFFQVGTSYILSRNARFRRGMNRRDTWLSYLRRSLVLLGLAYLYKIVDLLFGVKWGEIRWTVDVLNIIAMSLLLVSTWDYLTWRYSWNRFSYLPAALVIIAISPYMFLFPLPAWLPKQAAWYLQGMPPNAFFTLFPFTAYSFFGAFVVERLLGEDAQKPFLSLPPLMAGLAGIILFAALISQGFEPLGTVAATTVFYMEAFILLLFGLLLCYFFQRFIGFGPLLIIGRHTMIGYWIHAKIVFFYFKPFIGASDWGTSFWLLFKTYLATFLLLLAYDRLKHGILKRKKKKAAGLKPAPAGASLSFPPD